MILMGCVIPGDEFAPRPPYTKGMDTAFPSPASPAHVRFRTYKETLVVCNQFKCRMGYPVYDSSTIKPTDVEKFHF
jgi:hypothetical protein